MQGSDSDDMVTESLGTLFRQMRRSRQKSLEEAAEDTCINIRALKALETDDYSAIRAEVFVRGFIRNYAEYLGMDPGEAIGIYERSGLRPPVREHAAPADGDDREETGRGLPDWWKKALAALAVLAVVVYAGAALLGGGEDETAVSSPGQIEAPAIAPRHEPAPGPRPVPAETAPEPEKAAEGTPPPAAARPQPARRDAAQAKPAPARPAAPRYTVTATFVEPTWMKIHIDGGPARQYTYHPGEKRVWKAGRRIRFFIGNAGGIRLNVNGEDMPPLGPSGEVAKLVIPDGLEKLRRRKARKPAKEKPAAPAPAGDETAETPQAATPRPGRDENAAVPAAAGNETGTGTAAPEATATPAPVPAAAPPPPAADDGGM